MEGGKMKYGSGLVIGRSTNPLHAGKYTKIRDRWNTSR